MKQMTKQQILDTDFSNIKIKSSCFEIDFHIINNINIITGDSAIGKSKLIADLQNVIEENRLGTLKVDTSFPVEFIKIMDKGSLLDRDFSRFNGGPYLIFIDDFDRYDCKEIRDFIFHSKNIFFIVSRGSLLGRVSKRGWYSLECSGSSYKLVSFIKNNKRFMELVGS